MTRRSLLIAGFLLLLTGCAGPHKPEDRLNLARAEFSDLPGWKTDRQGEALAAFSRSCDRFMKKSPDDTIGKGPLAAPARLWQETCRHLPVAADDTAVRAFFERWFTPFRVSNRSEEEGTFTGYYEPLLYGSRRPSVHFSTPLYRLPAECEEGESCYSRAEIYRGALNGRGLELLWVNDAVDAFFLEVQGSGRVQLDDGAVVQVGYAGKNNQDYVAIGRVLVDRGEMTRDEASLASIKAWLREHPNQSWSLLEENPSYVFFEERAKGPLGAEGTVLTPERSLAVDSYFIPYGVPVFLETTLPAPPAPGDEELYEPELEPYQHLLIAQDRGGAIKGPVRGDVFFGFGPRAEALAGEMKQPGRYALLLPRGMAQRFAFRQ